MIELVLRPTHLKVLLRALVRGRIGLVPFPVDFLPLELGVEFRFRLSGLLLVQESIGAGLVRVPLVQLILQSYELELIADVGVGGFFPGLQEEDAKSRTVSMPSSTEWVWKQISPRERPSPSRRA